MHLALFDFDGTITSSDTWTPFVQTAVPPGRLAIAKVIASSSCQPLWNARQPCEDRPGANAMTQNRHREGQTRTCPYCGQASRFSLRTRVPRTGSQDQEAGGRGDADDCRPGWICENRNCWKRYDLEA